MLLAIDTSTRSIGIALLKDERILGEMTWESRSHHTVELAPAVSNLLASSGLSLNDLEAVGVAIGPGSFTGLRIGLAFAKGILLSHACTLIGVPTLDIIARALPPGAYRLAAVLEAGRGRLAVGWYKAEDMQWKRTGKYENLTVLELRNRIRRKTLVCGELSRESRKVLARKYKNVMLPGAAACVRRPAVLAELAWEKVLEGQADNPAALSPIYLHHGQPIPE